MLEGSFQRIINSTRAPIIEFYQKTRIKINIALEIYIKTFSEN